MRYACMGHIGYVIPTIITLVVGGSVGLGTVGQLLHSRASGCDQVQASNIHIYIYIYIQYTQFYT